MASLTWSPQVSLKCDQSCYGKCLCCECSCSVFFSHAALLLVIYPAFWEFRKFPLWFQICKSHLPLNDRLCNCSMTIAPSECMHAVWGGGRSLTVPPSLCRDPRTAVWQQVSLPQFCGFQSGIRSFQAFEVKAITSESPSQSFYIILIQFQQKMLLLYFFTICSNDLPLTKTV